VDVKKVPGKLDLYYAGMNYNKAGEYQESINMFNKYIELYPNESFGYFMNGRNYAKLDSLDNGSNALNNYLRIVSMTDSIKDKPGEMDRIKGTLRYLIEYYANVRRDKDSAILYTDKGIALDPADTDFVTIKEQLSKITNMKPVPRGTTPPPPPAAPAKPAAPVKPAGTKPAAPKPTGTTKTADPKTTALQKK
jgi:tetratricopeptide (TPR) repeat protein